MITSFTVESAGPAQAADIAALMRRSITELCVADHHNDPALLDEWLDNKTESDVCQWMEDAATVSLVALADDGPVGFAMMDSRGNILLMYVSPEATGQGVGDKLLCALEVRARASGLNRLTLESTVNARSFYQKYGFTDASDGSGQPGNAGKLQCRAMEKNL